eukprot:Clim_evm14s54 gene=Clim_evmTU14s54
MSKENFIAGQLSAFFKGHGTDAEELDSVITEGAVVTYITEPLADADTPDELIELADMILAYLPSAEVEQSEVCAWLETLRVDLKQRDQADTDDVHRKSQTDNVKVMLSPSSHFQSMYPSLDLKEIEQILDSIVDFDIGNETHVDQATDLLLQAVEDKAALNRDRRESADSKGSQAGEDNSIKNIILDRYFGKEVIEGNEINESKIRVDPNWKKTRKDAVQEPKTMYRNGQVVSTRGERYSVIKDPREDTEEMKKTYVNLKPARKYRFH